MFSDNGVVTMTECSKVTGATLTKNWRETTRTPPLTLLVLLPLSSLPFPVPPVFFAKTPITLIRFSEICGTLTPRRGRPPGELSSAWRSCRSNWQWRPVEDGFCIVSESGLPSRGFVEIGVPSIVRVVHASASFHRE